MRAYVRVVAVLAVVLFLPLAAGAQQAQPAKPAQAFSDLIAGYSSMALAEPVRPIKDVKLQSGHLTIVLLAGNAVPVLAGGKLAGIFFAGQGTFRYTSEDPVEFPVMAFNTKKNTDLELVSEGATRTLGSSFERLLWLTSGVAVPALPDGASDANLQDLFTSHVEAFSLLRPTPRQQQLAAARLNAPDRPLVRVEIGGKGKNDDYFYVLDGTDAKSESFSWVYKPEATRDRPRAVTLSDQPYGKNRRDPLVPRFILSHVDLNITASTEKDVTLGVTETFTGVNGVTRVLLLDLFDTMFGRSINDPRHLLVKSIVDDTGATLPFDHSKDQLAIGLARPLAQGQSTTLRFEIAGDVLYNPGGDSYWELGVAPWFPQPDLAGQYATFHTTVKVRKPFVPFVPGKTVRRAEEGEYNLVETKLDKPVQFMVVLAGKYEYEEETANGITVRIATYAGKRERGIKRLLNLNRKIIEYYTSFLGPFPFDEFNIVEINALGFGQAPPGFMFITSEAFNPLGETINKAYSRGINERFAHEIAHQYWGHVLKMPSGEEQWLTEAFAEISAGLLINGLRGKGEFETMQTGWKARAKEATESAPIPLANRLAARSDWPTAQAHRTHLLYSKGPWLLNSVRKEIGDERFLVFLNACQATMPWKFGNTPTVQLILETVTKKSWKQFFDDYYWGTAMPEK